MFYVAHPRTFILGHETRRGLRKYSITEPKSTKCCAVPYQLGSFLAVTDYFRICKNSTSLNNPHMQKWSPGTSYSHVSNCEFPLVTPYLLVIGETHTRVIMGNTVIRSRGYKPFSCSTQLRTKFFLLIIVKMPTVLGILIFMSRKNSDLGL